MTNIAFYCAGCGKRFVADENRAGQTFPCLNCQATVNVPQPIAIQDIIEANPTPWVVDLDEQDFVPVAMPHRKHRKQKSKQSTHPLVLALAGILSCLIFTPIACMIGDILDQGRHRDPNRQVNIPPAIDPPATERIPREIPPPPEDPSLNIVTLHDPRIGFVALTTNTEVYRALGQMVVSDAEAFEIGRVLAEEGMMISVPDGTHAVVLETRIFSSVPAARVEIKSGVHQGRQGWLPQKFVQTQEN